MKKSKIEALKKAIALPKFQHRFLLKIALNHPDYTDQKTNLSDREKEKMMAENQGLTNLGSAVFARIVSNYLSSRWKKLGEATLTIVKSDLVSTEMLCKFARELKLNKLALLAESYNWKHKSERKKILAGIFEAVLGAIYLELNRDLEKTEKWLGDRFLEPAVNNLLTEVLTAELEETEADCQLLNWVDSLGIPYLRCYYPHNALPIENRFLFCSDRPGF